MARLIYSLLLGIATPLILLRLLVRSRKQPAYRAHIGERFGRYPAAPDRSCIWLHAVSVGEMRAAQTLVSALRTAHPQHAWLITCMTPTGRATAQELYGDFACIAYTPYDFAGATGRFLDRFAPALGILMETEIWPNLLAAAARRRLPIILANARLSAKSAAGYARFGPLVRPAFASLAAVAAQTRADADRLAQLGATAPQVCGNLKFDIRPPPHLLSLGRNWRREIGHRRVILGASTRDGEEALLLEAFVRIRARDTLLLLVPRHPQRFDDVADLARSAGLKVERRSTTLPHSDTQVWIGDSMGEMVAYYACADLVVMGGSLGPFGSQNLIEAAACGCPLIVGPSDFNFSQATADALEAGAAVRVAPEAASIAAAIDSLLDDEERNSRMRAAALQFAGAHGGATERIVTVVEAFLR